MCTGKWCAGPAQASHTNDAVRTLTVREALVFVYAFVVTGTTVARIGFEAAYLDTGARAARLVRCTAGLGGSTLSCRAHAGASCNQQSTGRGYKAPLKPARSKGREGTHIWRLVEPRSTEQNTERVTQVHCPPV